MKSFVFDLQMFAMSFENGKISFTLNGLSVTLTGKNIKVDKKGVVTVSGKVNVTQSAGGKSHTSTATISKGAFSLDSSTGKLTIPKGISITRTNNGRTLTTTALSTLTEYVIPDKKGNLTFKSADDGFLQNVIKDGNTVISKESFNFVGTVSFDNSGNLKVAKGSSVTVKTNHDSTLKATVAEEGGANFSVSQSGVLTLKSAKEAGSIDFTASKNGKVFFGGNLSVANGKVTYDMSNGNLNASKNTTATFTTNNYQTVLKPTGDLSVKLAMDDGKLVISDTDKDKLKVVIKNTNTSSEIFNSTVQVTGGTATLSSDGTFTLGKNTSLITTSRGVTVTAKLADDSKGAALQFVDGALNIGGMTSVDLTVERDSKTLFSGNITALGSVSYNPSSGALTMSKDSQTVLSYGSYTIFLTPSTDLTTIINFDGEKLNITNQDDGLLEAIVFNGDTAVFSGYAKASGSLEIDLNNNIINGTNKNDNLTGTASDDIMSGLAGNDTLKGLAGDDILNGGKGNDILLGGEGNDTLNGESGNNKLTGGKGNDIFVHFDGKDVITDYETKKDIIVILDDYTAKVSGNDVIFTVAKNNTVTVKNGKGVDIVIRDNSNGKTTTYNSSSKSSKVTADVSALFAEDNFVTADNLSEIVKTDWTPAEFEKISGTKFENLTQENSLITYSDK
ncbi:MAG: hypothetical protein IK062_02785 [Selenomonadaceae bacterium]|nr:hypothetical protein [Selenomonadaceae bacterium]